MIMPTGCCIFTYIVRELSRKTHIYVETHAVIKKYTIMKKQIQLCGNTKSYQEIHIFM
jgi:hypothetical protein